MAAKLLPSRSSSFSSSRPSVLPSGRHPGGSGVSNDPSAVVSTLLTLPESASLIEQLFVSGSSSTNDSSSGPGTVVYVQQVLNNLTVQQASRSEELRNLIGMRYLSFLHSTEHIRSMVEASTDLHGHVSKVCNFVSELSQETDSEHEKVGRDGPKIGARKKSARHNGKLEGPGDDTPRNGRLSEGGEDAEDSDGGLSVHPSFTQKMRGKKSLSDQGSQGGSIALLDSTPLDSWLDDGTFSGQWSRSSGYSPCIAPRARSPSRLKRALEDRRCTYTSDVPYFVDSSSSSVWARHRSGQDGLGRQHPLIRHLSERALRDLLLQGMQQQMILSSRFWRFVRDSSFLCAFRLLCIEAPSQQRDLSMLSDCLQKKKNKVLESDCAPSLSLSARTAFLKTSEDGKMLGSCREEASRSSLVKDCQAILKQKREELRCLLQLLGTYSLQSLSVPILSSGLIPIHACATLLFLDTDRQKGDTEGLYPDPIRNRKGERTSSSGHCGEAAQLPPGRIGSEGSETPDNHDQMTLPRGGGSASLSSSPSASALLTDLRSGDDFLAAKLFSVVSLFFNCRVEALRRLPFRSPRAMEQSAPGPETAPAPVELSFFCSRCRHILQLLEAEKTGDSVGDALPREEREKRMTPQTGSVRELRSEGAVSGKGGRRLVTDSPREQKGMKGVGTPRLRYESGFASPSSDSSVTPSSSACLCCILHDLLFAFESSVVATGVVFLSSPPSSCVSFLTKAEARPSVTHSENAGQERRRTPEAFSASSALPAATSSEDKQDHFLMLEVAKDVLVSSSPQLAKPLHAAAVKASRPTSATKKEGDFAGLFFSSSSSSDLVEEPDQLYAKLSAEYARRISFYMSIFPRIAGADQKELLSFRSLHSGMLQSLSSGKRLLGDSSLSVREHLPAEEDGKKEDLQVLSAMRSSFLRSLQANFARFWLHWKKEALWRVKLLLRDAKERALINRSVDVKRIWDVVLQRLEESRNAFLLFAAPSPSLQSSTLSAFEASCTKNGSDFLTERRPGHGDVWGSEDFFPVGARKTPSPVLSSGVVWRRLWKRTLDELLSSLPTTSADEASSPFPRSQECPGGKQRALSSSLVADSSLPTPACVTVEARRATQAEEEKKGVGPDTEKSQQLGQAWNVVMVAVREICRNFSKELLEEQIVRHLSFLWTRHGDASEDTSRISTLDRRPRWPSFTEVLPSPSDFPALSFSSTSVGSSLVSSAKTAEKDLKTWLATFETTFLRLLNDLVYIHLDLTPPLAHAKTSALDRGEREQHQQDKEGSLEKVSLGRTTSFVREREDGDQLFLCALLAKLRHEFDTALIPYLSSYYPSSSSSFSSSSFSLSLFPLNLSAFPSPCASLWGCRGRALELLLLGSVPPHARGQQEEGRKKDELDFLSVITRDKSQGPDHSSGSLSSAQGVLQGGVQQKASPQRGGVSPDERAKSQRENSSREADVCLLSSSSFICGEDEASSNTASFSSFLRAFLSRGSGHATQHRRAPSPEKQSSLTPSFSSVGTLQGERVETVGQGEDLFSSSTESRDLLGGGEGELTRGALPSLYDMAKEVYRELSAGSIACFTIVSFELLKDCYVDYHRALESIVFENDEVGFWTVEEEGRKFSRTDRRGSGRPCKKRTQELMMAQVACRELDLADKRDFRNGGGEGAGGDQAESRADRETEREEEEKSAGEEDKARLHTQTRTHKSNAEELRELFCRQAGLEELENRFCLREFKNRKTGVRMRRIWIQAKFQRKQEQTQTLPTANFPAPSEA